MKLPTVRELAELAGPAGLSAGERGALALAVAGYTTDEIAALEQRTPRAIRYRLASATRKLADAYASTQETT